VPRTHNLTVTIGALLRRDPAFHRALLRYVRPDLPDDPVRDARCGAAATRAGTGR
jgi:hypothetical protein